MAEVKPRKDLINQPSAKPTRKLRAGGYVLAALTVGTYVLGAVQGNEIIDQQSGMEALGVLVSGGIPWLTAYFARSEAP
jgi:hypothetical protein